MSSGQVTNNAFVPNQTSYQYKRIADSGNVDTIQLNLTDNTLSNMDFQTQLDCINKMKDTATEPSGYMNTGRTISSISIETLPLDHSFKHNHQDINSEITQYDNDEVEERDVPHDTGYIDVTEEQDKMSKKNSRE